MSNFFLKSCLVTLLLTTISFFPSAQISIQDIANVDVEALTDQQVNQILHEINTRGLSIEEAGELAKVQGATQLQVNTLKARLRNVRIEQSSEIITDHGLPQYQESQGGNNSHAIVVASQPQGDVNVSEQNRKIFGFQLFNKDNLTFEPSLNLPVPPDYVIGIGDEIIINVWGASQQTYQLTVNHNGVVIIPDIGPINVAGRNHAVVKNDIKNRLTSIYNGMTGQNPNTFSDVSVNNSKAIKVNVIGEAILPGTYTLPATASAFNALYLSGGPNERGSFRNIRIIRNNKQVAEIDVYDYLIHGNTENNINLRDQDVILIPTFEKQVETTGAFMRNAIFELKENENIGHILGFTGGFSADASGSRLLLTRFGDGQFKLMDIDKADFENVELINGDIIRAEKIIDRYENRLVIEGAVFRPGTYALEEGMTLSGLIGKAGGLREDYFAQRGIIIRLDEQLYPTIIPFNVHEVMEGSHDPKLKREDEVIIRDIFDIGERKTVRIYGEVMRPAEYNFSKNMTLKDLVFLAGGMKESASESFVEVARRNSYEEASKTDNKMVSLFQFNIDRNLGFNEEDADFILSPFDQVYIRRAPSYLIQQTVSVTGEVKYPGEYSIVNKNERISDLFERVGGLVPTAYAKGARMQRLVDRQFKNQMEIVQRLEVNTDTSIELDAEDKYYNIELRLSEILNNPGSVYDYTLKDGDRIYVPLRMEGVRINGEVLSPMSLAWEKNKPLKHYINNSGGFNHQAKKGKIYVVYSNGTTEVTKSFLVRKYPNVEPGCQIIVPAKPEKDKSDRTTVWLAFVSAFSSLALAAAAIMR